jgi:hypothetical protein
MLNFKNSKYPPKFGQDPPNKRDNKERKKERREREK